jgi:hypothetical protein
VAAVVHMLSAWHCVAGVVAELGIEITVYCCYQLFILAPILDFGAVY